MMLCRSAAFVAALSLAFVTLLPEARADTPPTDETVIVTATRAPRMVKQTGSSVTIITDKDIAARGAVFAIDVLRDVPGVQVTLTRGLASVRLRGEESYRTALIVDGLKLSDVAGTQVSFNFANLLAANIARIEILRGPQALLYGADAIGGVIVVTTKRGGQGFEAGLAGEGGSYGLAQGEAFVRGGQGAFDAALSVSGFSNDGQSAQEGPGFVERDPFDVMVLHATAGWRLSETARLEAVGRYTDADSQFDRFDFGLGIADTDNRLTTEQWSGLLALDWKAREWLALRAEVSLMEQERRDFANGAPFIFGHRFDSERLRASLFGRAKIAEGHDLVLSGDYEDEGAQTDALDRSRASRGVLAEYQGAVTPQLFMTAGLRYDDHDQFGEHVSWRATAAYAVSESLTLRGSAGTGFRAPSLFELFDGFSGNPLLTEERGQGWDIGLDAGLGFWQGTARLSYFDQRVEDEIRFDPILFVYQQNASTTVSRGVEASLGVTPLEGLSVDATYTYTDAQIASADAENGLPRARRPRHLGSVTVNYAFAEGRANLNANLQTAAKEQDGFFTFRSNLEGRAVVNLAGSYRVLDSVTLTLRGQNVFDERYQEARGFSTPRAGIFAGAKVVF